MRTPSYSHTASYIIQSYSVIHHTVIQPALRCRQASGERRIYPAASERPQRFVARGHASGVPCRCRVADSAPSRSVCSGRQTVVTPSEPSEPSMRYTLLSHAALGAQQQNQPLPVCVCPHGHPTWPQQAFRTPQTTTTPIPPHAPGTGGIDRGPVIM